jgi:hypothetical protein
MAPSSSKVFADETHLPGLGSQRTRDDQNQVNRSPVRPAVPLGPQSRSDRPRDFDRTRSPRDPDRDRPRDIDTRDGREQDWDRGSNPRGEDPDWDGDRYTKVFYT